VITIFLHLNSQKIEPLEFHICKVETVREPWRSGVFVRGAGRQPRSRAREGLGRSPGTALALASQISWEREHHASSSHRTSFQTKYEPARVSALGRAGGSPGAELQSWQQARQGCGTRASLVPPSSGPLRLSQCHLSLGVTFHSGPLPGFARFLAPGHKVAVFWLGGRRGEASFGCFY